MGEMQGDPILNGLGCSEYQGSQNPTSCQVRGSGPLFSSSAEFMSSQMAPLLPLSLGTSPAPPTTSAEASSHLHLPLPSFCAPSKPAAGTHAHRKGAVLSLVLSEVIQSLSFICSENFTHKFKAKSPVSTPSEARSSLRFFHSRP